MEPAAKILVVDDNEQNLTLIRVILQRHGYDSHLVRSGEEALRQVVEDPPDLILLDVMMPGMDGIEVCRRLKDDEETGLIPIVIMTALNQPEDKIRGIEAGADDFLTKPVHRDELLARIRTSLRLKQTIDRKILKEEASLRQAERKISEQDKVLYRLLLERAERDLLESVDELRDLTVMFLDLVGFSSMSRAERQEKIEMLRTLGSMLMHRAGGMYVNTWGDAIIAGFDDPNDGLACACKIIEHLAVEQIVARIGMSYGKASVKYNPLTKRLDIEGDSINVGARLEPMANPGEVLVTKELRYYPDVKQDRFIFTLEKRPLQKAVGDKPKGTLIECYAVALAKGSGGV